MFVDLPAFPPCDASRASWRRVLAARDGGAIDAPDPWGPVFGPLTGTPVGSRVVAQLGQSLDGRVATPTGHSHYVNGPEAIAHLHRLRALSDAVLVGASTVAADDPALTVRHVEGRSPCRVVIDPRGRTAPGARWLVDDGVRRIVLVAPGVEPALPDGVERVEVPTGADGRMAPAAIVATLAARGLRRLLVEGGAHTVSGFVAAGRVDRLHLLVAPIVIGSGPVGLTLPPIERMDDALRPPARRCRLGDDLLWDLALGR